MTNHLISRILPADRDPDRPCIICQNGRRYSYGEVVRWSRRYAAALRAAGVTVGDRVAAQVEKSPEALFLYLGSVRAGAIFLPLNTAYTPSEIGYFLGDAEPAMFVADPAKLELLRPVAAQNGVGRTETLGADGSGSLPDLVAAAQADAPDAARSADDLAAILYTSGTTGRSKGAMLSHGNLLSNAEALLPTWGFTGEDVLIHALPIFHTHGLFVATNLVLLSGASMIFQPKFDAAGVIEAMAGATVLMGVPTFYTRLLDQPGLDRAATERMRLFISGSAPLLAETHRAFAERTGHAILERYGMTETNMNTSNPLVGARVPGSVGFPLPGVDLRICDQDTGKELPTGEIGVIEVRGPNVFSGYWRMPEKTRSEFRPDGFFITGDLGRIDEHGYVWILGRGKDLVITGGYNVYPKEIELEIDAIPGVVESAVIGVPHPDFGEAVVAVVVPERGADISEGDIAEALRPRLANYKLPKRVVMVDELPRNTMAKVQKNILRDSYRDILAEAPTR
ncbi:MAG: malonyl-CoA synthase [Rhizobiaceae bacterium]|nr:malonyl-CoA synthase [Rhizobiaceae bacterium]